MKRTFILLFLLVGLCAHLCAQQPFTCHVTLDSVFHGNAYLTTVRDSLVRVKTLRVDSNEFDVSYDISRADEYRLSVRPYRFGVSILAEPGCHYDIKVAGDDVAITTEKGREQNLWNGLEKQMAPIYAKATVLANEYMRLKEAGDTAAAETQLDKYRAYYDSINGMKRQFVEAHPNTLAGLRAAADFLSMEYLEMRRVYDCLEGNPYKYAFFWESFNKRYQELADKWIQGNEAPDFTTKDDKGNTVRLSDFRGRYVLLDFWASWCVPCRAKMKELKRIYPQLKAKGIEVVSISMDENRAAWLKASEQDGIEWTNTCDVKPFKENAIGKAYKVTAVPTLFVISPQGIVEAQNPTIDEILQLQ